jgi:hypothetical protein
MSAPLRVKRDTKAWIFQVWFSFMIAFSLCSYGIWKMQNEMLERAFLTMAFFFCLSSSFVLAKCIRDNQYHRVDTTAWRVQVWAAFAIAVGLTGWGVQWLELPDPDRDYLVASGLFLLSATFTLTKTVRDKHEADEEEARLRGEPDSDLPGGVKLDK